MTKQEFGEVMEMLGGAYGAKFAQVDSAVAKMWYECLKDVEFQWIKRAAIQWAQENKYPPTISELRELAKKIEEQAYKSERVKKWQ